MNDTTEKNRETVERVPVTVRLRPESLCLLDSIRGQRSRQHMIEGAVDAVNSGLIDVPEPPAPKAILVDNGAMA